MDCDNAIALARKHISCGGSNEANARVCLADAIALRNEWNYEDAKARALASLKYSVGVFHKDYCRAAK